MEKFCVFCGNKPEKKNKEHIIPQWLIKKTGEANRKGYWGIDYQDMFNPDVKQPKRREYPFMKFTFPACEKCNSKFGTKLEGDVDRIVTHILNEEPLSEADLTLLLDWFDKVRVGMWLAYNYYNSNMSVKPKFHIESRIRKSDRVLCVYKTSDNFKGINFFGPGTLLYTYCPSFLGMSINNYFFINLSTDNLLLTDLGLFTVNIDKMDLNANYWLSASLGSECVSGDVVKKLNVPDTDVMIFQPIYSKLLSADDALRDSIFDSNYVKENSIDTHSGLGKVFVLEQGEIKTLNDGEYILKPKAEYPNAAALMKTISMRISKMMIQSITETCERLKCVDGSETMIQNFQCAIEYEKSVLKSHRNFFDKICERNGTT